MSMVEREPRRECDIFKVGGDVRRVRITVEQWSDEHAAYRDWTVDEKDMGKRARRRFQALLSRAVAPPSKKSSTPIPEPAK